jgi:hypothetical protein
MRGLEPPPGFPDTDLNRTEGVQMRPPASRSSVLSGFPDASDTSDDMTVATVLPRSGQCSNCGHWASRHQLNATKES